jgi:hypothetical protein
VILEFKGNKFTGEILPELHRIHQKGIVRIIDLVFLRKDKDGQVDVIELSDLPGGLAMTYDPLAGEITGLLTKEDAQKAADALPVNSSAALLLFEHLWAIHLKEALINAGAELVARGYVPPDLVAKVETEIAAASK